jgi:hypothetical protein
MRATFIPRLLVLNALSLAPYQDSSRTTDNWFRERL